MDKRGAESSAQEIQQELSEIERDLALRRLLWESQEEWESLSVQWKETAFDSLDVDSLQKNVNRFTQTVYMLEKGRRRFDIVYLRQFLCLKFHDCTFTIQYIHCTKCALQF